MARIILFYFLFVFGCNEPITEVNSDYEVDPDATVNLPLSQIFNGIRYIPLAMTQPPIGEINKLILRDSTIYVSELGKPILHIFSIDGSFLRAINIGGNGPGQVTSITDFCINDDSEDIAILNRTNAKVVMYDQNGNFKNIEIKLTGYPQAISYMHGNVWCSYNGNEIGSEYRFSVFNEKAIINNYIPIEGNYKSYLNFFELNNFFHAEDELLAYFAHNNNLYQIDTNKIEVYRHIDFGKYSIPNSFYDKEYETVFDFVTELEKEDYAYKITSYLESSSGIYFGFFKKDNFLYHIGGNDRKLNLSVWKDDFTFVDKVIEDRYEFQNTIPRGIVNNHLYGYYQADLVAGNKLVDETGILGRVGELDNPVIYLLHHQLDSLSLH